MSDKIVFKFVKFKANYNSNIYFKTKVSLKEQNLSKEGEQTHKYEKNKVDLAFEETLEFDNFSPLKSTSKFSFYLLVYTKTGFKPAGAGDILYSKIKNGEINTIEIKKCPLGNVSYEVIINVPSSESTTASSVIKPAKKVIEKEENTVSEPPKVLKKQQKKLDDFEDDEEFSKPKPKPKVVANNPPKEEKPKEIKKQQKKLDDFEDDDDFSKPKPKPKVIAVNNPPAAKKLTSFDDDEDDSKSSDILRAKKPINNDNNTKLDANYESQLKAKDSLIQELKDKNGYFEEENSQLNGIIKDLKEEKRKLLEEKNEMIRQQREENEKLKKDLEDIQIEKVNLTNTYNILLEEKKGLDSNSQAVLATQTQTKIELDKLKLENTRITNELNSIKEENQNLTEKLTAKEEELNKITEDQKSAKENMNTELTSKQNEILAQIEKSQLKDSEIATLKEELNKLKEENEAFQSKIDLQLTLQASNENSEIQILNDQLQLKEKQINDFKTENEKLKLANLKLEEDISFAQNEKDNSLEFAKSNERKLKEDLLSQRNLIENYTAKIQELNDENLRLKKENETGRLELKNIESSQISNDSFINQIQDIQKAAAEKEVQISILTEENENLKRENANLKESNNKKKGASSTDNKKYLREIENLKEQKKSLEDDLSYYKNLNMTFVDSEKKSTLLESENIQIKNELAVRTEACEKFQKEILELSQKVKDLEDEVMMKTEKIGQLLNELVEAEK